MGRLSRRPSCCVPSRHLTPGATSYGWASSKQGNRSSTPRGRRSPSPSSSPN